MGQKGPYYESQIYLRFSSFLFFSSGINTQVIQYCSKLSQTDQVLFLSPFFVFFMLT